jgi:hypothetical protein
MVAHTIKRWEVTIKHLTRRGCVAYVTLIVVCGAADHLKKEGLSNSRIGSTGAPAECMKGSPTIRLD